MVIDVIEQQAGVERIETANLRRPSSGDDDQPSWLSRYSMAIATALTAVFLLSGWLLGRLEDPDVNVRAANTFSLNDFISNGGILVAGALVWWLGSNWPDLVVGVAVASIAAWGGIGILRDAHREHHKAVHQGDGKT